MTQGEKALRWVESRPHLEQSPAFTKAWKDYINEEIGSGIDYTREEVIAEMMRIREMFPMEIAQ